MLTVHLNVTPVETPVQAVSELPLFFWRPSAKAKVPRDAYTVTLRVICMPFDSPFGFSPPAPCCFFLFGAVELASESNSGMRNYFGVNYLR
jgi:hypothetical protein